MYQFNSLVNPHGAGIVLTFWWYVVVSTVAMNVAGRVFRRSPVHKSLTEAFYLVSGMIVLVLFIILTFYVPYVLREEPATPASYQSISNLLVWTGIASAVVWIAILLATVHVIRQRRSTVWYWPFVWLLLAQMALAYYAVVAAGDRVATYDYWSSGSTWVEVWSPRKYYVALAAALVFTVIAAGNLVLARKALRRAQNPQPVRDPREITWLDQLVISLAAMHGVQPPWDLSTLHNPDDPEDDTPSSSHT